MFPSHSLHFFILLALSLSTVASAQTPSGFTPSVPTNQTLTVSFTNTTISPPGLLIPRAVTALPPRIISPVAPATSRGLLFMIDIDVPRNNTRTTLLHWFVPNVTFSASATSSSSTSGGGYIFNTNATGVEGAPYLQPNPGVGDIPHDYILLLFAQPANLSLAAIGYGDIDPPASTNDRIGFNITDFAAKAGLGSPLAANYFRVQNTTGVASTTYPGVNGASATATSTATVTPYRGGVAGDTADGWRWKEVVAVGVAAGLGVML